MASDSNIRVEQKSEPTHFGLTVATLNIRGGLKKKFKDIRYQMRNERIAILAVQETHLTPEGATDLMAMYRDMHIETHSDSTNAMGVAFIFNKDLVDTSDVESEDINKNRILAAKLTIEGKKLLLLNVYLPNAAKESAAGLKGLLRHIRQTDMKPDLILGDFNLVEDPIDRLPARPEHDDDAVDAWVNIKMHLNLVDGWRATHEEELGYTFHQPGTGSKSRIDRIYTPEENLQNTVNWSMSISGHIGDHDMATVHIIDDNAPTQGHGRWRLPNDLLKDGQFCREAEIVIRATNRKLQSVIKNTPESNTPMTVWLKFKEKIRNVAKTRRKAISSARTKMLFALTDQLEATLKDPSYASNDDLQDESEILHTEIAALKGQAARNAQTTAATRYMLEGETVSKYWLQMNKPKNRKATIAALNSEEGETRDTETMAEIARKHHEKLQEEQTLTPERKRAIERLLKKIDVKFTEEDIAVLEENVTTDLIEEALRDSSNGTAPGKDGIPFEFYKHFHDRAAKSEGGDPLPSVVLMLRDVLNWVETSGDAPAEFTEGTMFLLYKKGDRRDIANYRPITLLNTDLKLFTKIQATKLGKVCHSVIHKDQAGFIPGRSIYDQVKLNKLTLDYAKASEQDGILISLDQEKAYDRIAHDYLWEVLKAYGAPDAFIATVKALYKNATTTIMMNGITSQIFRVLRGLRQGDPPSCILFDIAIEPLANALRKSDLSGIRLPGDLGRLICTLFADDTSVFLSKTDTIARLTETLDLYCTASTAKFNLGKTVGIPMGSDDFRESVLATRQMTPDGETIPADYKLAQDGEATRVLGGWIGNNINEAAPWAAILEKQQTVMSRWAGAHPSLAGKKIIIGTLVYSLAQYLATVNGMPKDVERRMWKQVKDFIWDGNQRGAVNEDILSLPMEKGGLGIPSMRARLDAINLEWCKKWLSEPEKRPTWAYLADYLIKQDVIESKMKYDKEALTHWALQTWDARKKGSKLPIDMQAMLNAARKFNVVLDAPKVSKETKNQLPAWINVKQSGRLANQLLNRKSSKCLIDVHGIRTMEDLEEDIPRNLRCATACNKVKSRLIEITENKWNPLISSPVKDGLDFTPLRLKRNKARAEKHKTAVINPDVTAKGPIERNYRVFVPAETTLSEEPAYRLKEPPSERDIRESKKKARVIYTDGSCENNGTLEARSGSGLFIKADHKLNLAFRVPGPIQTNQRGEAVAALLAVEKTHRSRKLRIMTDSRYVYNALTKNIQDWEDTDYLGRNNDDVFRKLIATIRQRHQPTEIGWVKGHSDDPGNNGADHMAGTGMRKELPDQLNLQVTKEFQVHGARLHVQTQASLYQRILKNMNEKVDILSARGNIERIQDAIHAWTGETPTEAQIWKGIFNEDIAANISSFLWRMVHNRLRCGDYWLRIEDKRDRAYCKACGELETIDHILLKCESPARKRVWDSAKAVWEKLTGTKWQEPNVYTMMGLGAMTKTKDGKILRGQTRLYRIMVAESAWLVWKTRNNLVMRDEVTTPEKAANVWRAIIAKKAMMDYAATCKLKFGRLARDEDLVKKTWIHRIDSMVEGKWALWKSEEELDPDD